MTQCCCNKGTDIQDDHTHPHLKLYKHKNTVTTKILLPDWQAHSQDLSYPAPVYAAHPKLQIRRSIDNNSKITFLILNENTHCDPSLELSWQDSSNEGSQCMFLWSNKKNYPQLIPVTPSYLDHWAHQIKNFTSTNNSFLAHQIRHAQLSWAWNFSSSKILKCQQQLAF